MSNRIFSTSDAFNDFLTKSSEEFNLAYTDKTQVQNSGGWFSKIGKIGGKVYGAVKDKVIETVPYIGGAEVAVERDED